MNKLSIFLNIFFSYMRFQWFVSKIAAVRAIWLKSQFGHCGRNFRIGKIGRLKGLKYVGIGNATILQEFVYLTAWETEENLIEGKFPSVRIGNCCNLGAFDHITCSNKIVIGNNCLIGKWVTITDNSHGNTDLTSLMEVPSDRKICSKGPVVIEDCVWIGDKATILPNVHIGRNAIIGANAVVTHDVPANAIAVGNPARVIKILSNEERERKRSEILPHHFN